MTEKFDEMAEQDGWHFSAEHSARNGRGGLDWLADLLRAPESAERLFYQRAVYRGWTALAPHQTRDAAIRENLSATVADLAPAPVVENLSLDDQNRVPGGFAVGLGHATQGVELLASLPLAAIESKSLPKTGESLAVHICFDDRDTEPTDEFKKAWRAFWHAANQLQFCSSFAMASRRAVSSGQLDKVWQTAKSIQSQAEQAEAALSESGPSWTEAETYSALSPVQLAALKALDLPAPEVGIDLVGKDGAVALGGELVELAWPDEKMAVVLEEPEYDLPGWRLVVADDSVAEKLKQAIEQGVA
jgi:DEAD/DEAH box helicase domain-containing protein